MAPRETENNDYAEFGGDKQRALWYVMQSLFLKKLSDDRRRNMLENV